MLGVLQEQAGGHICRLLGCGEELAAGCLYSGNFSLGTVGQVIKDIEPGSPAEAAGLKNNDLVVAVNGESVEALDHDSVVEMVRKGGDQTTLLVLDKEADRIYSLVSNSGNTYIHALRLVSSLMPSSLGLSCFVLQQRRCVTIMKAKLWLKLAVTGAC